VRRLVRFSAALGSDEMSERCTGLQATCCWFDIPAHAPFERQRVYKSLHHIDPRRATVLASGLGWRVEVMSREAFCEDPINRTVECFAVKAACFLEG